MSQDELGIDGIIEELCQQRPDINARPRLQHFIARGFGFFLVMCIGLIRSRENLVIDHANGVSNAAACTRVLFA